MEGLLALLCFLISLAMVLAIVAVVGHGLWLMAAALFGGGQAGAERLRESTRRGDRACLGCGEIVRWDESNCRSCGLAPDSRAADELKDLEAAARTVQRLREQQALSAETCEQVYKSIEARQEELLPRGRRRETAQLAQLETWFGDDLGRALSITDKKRALALARMLEPKHLEALSFRALVGLARLQASVGMLSRACQVYQVLFATHPQAPIGARAAREAIQTACQLEDWPTAEEFACQVSAIPGLVDGHPELAVLIAQVQARDFSMAPTPIVEATLATSTPEVQPALEMQVADAPVEIVAVPAPVEPMTPAAPRRTFAEWIGVFMEERNILWGELIGGTLIVGCSIALVISLWNTLEQFEYFPFLILAAITSAIFSAGYYTLHHWKLESTSRGLLLIATLLVPLDFLVLAGLTRVEGAGTWDYLLAIGALAAFGWFLYRSSHILVQTPVDVRAPSALLVAGAMVVSAAAQLIAPAWLAQDEWRMSGQFLLSLLPVLAHVGVLGWILLRLGGVEAWSIGRLVALLIALGSVTFACCVTLSYPLYAADDLRQALLHLSPALTLLGTPILVAGTLIHQKLASPSDGGESHGLWRTLGTGLALAGLFVMFGGFVASVGDPALRWLCGAINLGTLLGIAWGLRVPALHVPGQVYLAALVVFGWQIDLDLLTVAPIVPLRLAGLLVVQAIVAELLIRWHRPIDARFYAVGSCVSTVLAGVLVVPFAESQPWAAALVYGTAALTWYAANLRWRFAELTYGCSLVLAGAIFFAFRHFTDVPIREQLLWSLLTHATICLAASVLLRFQTIDWLHETFRIPLTFASLLATFFAAAILIVEQFPANFSWTDSCIGCCWLAALWLILAAVEGWPILFGAFQIALGAAWVFGAGGWLTRHGWDWREPYSLHVFGLGVGALSLTWEIVRLTTRTKPRAAALLAPAFVPVDRLITGALVIGQYVLLLCVISWSIGRELSATPDAWRVLPAAWHDNAYSILAWLLQILLMAVLVVWLREVKIAFPLLGFTILLLSVPLLVAGTWFDASLAAASALRWGLALCYGIASLLLWYRHRLGTERSESVPALAIRAMLAVGALAPVLFLTVQVAARKLGHIDMPGPLDESLFIRMTGPVSLLVPLALLSAILAGHGFRERLAYYLLAAGLLANASSVGGYFLALQKLDKLGEPWVVVYALLLASGVAWLWTIVWTWSASVLEPEDDRPLLESPLLRVNDFLGGMLFAGVLVPALLWIILATGEVDRHLPEAAGSAWCWLVFALMALGSCFAFWKRRGSLPLSLLGTLSLTTVGVGACSVELYAPGNGFVALMFGAALYACVWVWSNLFLDRANPPRWLTFTSELWESVIYAGVAGGLAVCLGLASMFRHPVWSAESIALAAFACGLLAYQRKTEIWTTLGTVLMMLAGTVLVLHLGEKESDRMLLTLHVNLAVLGAMSLLWLGLHRFVAPPESVLAQRPLLLSMQLSVGMVGNGMILGAALLELIFVPDRPRIGLAPLADWSGWLALTTNIIATLWHVGVVRPRAVVHAVSLAGLGFGITLARSIDASFPDSAWLAHHVLTLAWTLLGLALLIVSWLSHAQDALGPRFWPAERRVFVADFLRRCFAEATTRLWVTLCGGFVVFLALRAAWVEPATPYWSVGNTFAVSVLLCALAIWARSSLYVFGSGLLCNVIGLLLFTAWSMHRNEAAGPMLGNDEWFSYFILAQILSFGAAAIVWSLLDRKLVKHGIDLARDIPLPFAQIALLAGIHLLAIGIGLASGLHLVGEEVRIGSTLAWISLVVLMAGSLLDSWRPNAWRITRFQLYTCGLLAIGLFLHDRTLPIADWYWTATLLLAGYVLLIVVLMRLVYAVPFLTEIVRGNTEPEAQARDQAGAWFWRVQLGSAALVLGLSLWITLTYATWQDRLAGALASSLVTTAAFLLVQAWPRLFASEHTALHHRLMPGGLVLTLAVFIAVEACWAFLDPTMTAVWLQRSAAALAVVGAAALLYRFGLTQLGEDNAWADAGRRVSAFLGPVCVALLLVLIGQELMSYNPDQNVRKAPLRIELVIAAALAILGLATAAFRAALTKSADDYGIENERRSFYVYLGELLTVALFAHLRLNIPDIFSKAIGERWYFVVMVLAFVILALSEIFKRKALPVLATPLKRSAIALAFVPVLAFRLAPLAHWSDSLSALVPGLSPFLRYLRTLAENSVLNIPAEAVCWLLLGIFFGAIARLHKSANLGIAAALFVNFGVWVLLGHQDATQFLHRPQLWLIPLGLIVLVAEFVNRDRLGFWPSLSVRYAGLLCIYLSSTFEMFRELVNQHAIYPIVLALLAVAGMLLGILFRVRAFLLSGFLALLTVIFAQIWNAAVTQGITWIWWVSGIVLGAIILAMFAVFEKHRNEVLKVIDNMKQWH